MPQFHLSVNGTEHEITAAGDTPLLYVLRNDLGLKAAHFGCGTGQCGACRVLLEGHAVVFLDVGIADAARRIGFDRSRPLLSVNPRASWIAMMNTRRPVYDRLAGLRVDTAGRTPVEVAQDIVDRLGGPR